MCVLMRTAGPVRAGEHLCLNLCVLTKCGHIHFMYLVLCIFLVQISVRIDQRESHSTVVLCMCVFGGCGVGGCAEGGISKESEQGKDNDSCI